LYHFKIIGLNLSTNEHLKGVGEIIGQNFDLNATVNEGYLYKVFKVLLFGRSYKSLISNAFMKESQKQLFE
jgi:hypothetical protein